MSNAVPSRVHRRPVTPLFAALLAAALTAGSVSANAQPMFAPGDDPALDAQQARHTRMFYAVHALPFGIGIDVNWQDDAALAAIREFLAADDALDLETSAGAHPFELLRGYSGPAGIGLRGGGAVPGTAFRYMALKREGAPEAELAAARRDVVRAIETLHVVVAITGEPGRVARGVQRLLPEDPSDPPLPLGDTRAPEPLFDEQGNPLPPEKNNGTRRADNSGGELPAGAWEWEDSCSRDQLVGWIVALATLYDAAKGDPDIDQALVTRMEEDARLVGAMLREKHEFTTVAGETELYDLVIMDADGRPTLHHDLNPNALEHMYFPNGQGFTNHFYLAMTLGIVTALYHVSGDPEAEQFLYGELLGSRGYLDLMTPEGLRGMLFAGTETNFSNVNMVAISLFLALYYEADPAVAAVYREVMEAGWWDAPGVRQAARNCKQPYYNAFYLATTDDGTDESLVAETARLLKDFELGPYVGSDKENCDEAELDAGSCVAIDGETVLELDPFPGRGGHRVATEALDPSLRPSSNFDARSDPFKVNGGGGHFLPGGDLHAAYWMLRYLEHRAPGAGAVSHRARTHIPVGGTVAPPTPTPDVIDSGDVDGAADAGSHDGAPDDAGTSPDAGAQTDAGPQTDTGGGGSGCTLGAGGDAGSESPLLSLLALFVGLLTLRTCLRARRVPRSGGC